MGILDLIYLAWHHFSINSTNVNSCIEASLVVRINNVPSKGFVSTNTTIIGALSFVRAHMRRNSISITKRKIDSDLIF